MKKRIFFKEYMRLEKRDSSRNSMRNNTNNLKRKVEKEVFYIYNMSGGSVYNELLRMNMFGKSKKNKVGDLKSFVKRGLVMKFVNFVGMVLKKKGVKVKINTEKSFGLLKKRVSVNEFIYRKKKNISKKKEYLNIMRVVDVFMLGRVMEKKKENMFNQLHVRFFITGASDRILENREIRYLLSFPGLGSFNSYFDIMYQNMFTFIGGMEGGNIMELAVYGTSIYFFHGINYRKKEKKVYIKKSKSHLWYF